MTTIMIMSRESVTGRMAASVSSRECTLSAGSLESGLFPLMFGLVLSRRWFWYQFLATLKRYKTILMIENMGIPYPNIITLFPKRKFIMPGNSMPWAILKKLLFSLFARYQSETSIHRYSVLTFFVVCRWPLRNILFSVQLLVSIIRSIDWSYILSGYMSLTNRAIVVTKV